MKCTDCNGQGLVGGNPTWEDPCGTEPDLCESCHGSGTIGRDVHNQTTGNWDATCGTCGGQGYHETGLRPPDPIQIECPDCKGKGKDFSMYPTIKKNPNQYFALVTLPHNTPINVVYKLAPFIGRRFNDYSFEISYKHYDKVCEILYTHFGNIVEERDKDDPNAPILLLIEYMGACKERDKSTHMSVICQACGGTGLSHANVAKSSYSRIATTICSTCNGQGRIVESHSESYASGWCNGNWFVRFPEKVLRAYFPAPLPAFDGDFFKALLTAPDIHKAYKQLARQYHPDAKGKRVMWDKLSEAYTSLKDPIKRKRYEAGLKFQGEVKKETTEWRCPKNCGDIKVRGKWESLNGGYTNLDRRLIVTEIVEWKDHYDKRGRVMVSTFNALSDPPFKITYEDVSEFVINV